MSPRLGARAHARGLDRDRDPPAGRAIAALAGVAAMTCGSCQDKDGGWPDANGVAVSDGVIYAVVPARRSGKANAIVQEGEIIRIDASSNDRVSVARAHDPCCLQANGGTVAFLEATGEMAVLDGSAGGSRGVASSQSGCAKPAIDTHGDLWWIGGDSVQRWSATRGSERIFDLRAALGQDTFDYCGRIAVSETLVAVVASRRDGDFFHDVLFASTKDGTSVVEIAAHVPGGAWVGLSGTTVTWATEPSVATELRARRVGAPAEEATAHVYVDTLPVLRGEELFWCGDDHRVDAQPPPHRFVVRARIGQTPHAIPDTECRSVDADQRQIVWLDDRSAIHTLAR